MLQFLRSEAKFEKAWEAKLDPEAGLTHTEMFTQIEKGNIKAYTRLEKILSSVKLIQTMLKNHLINLIFLLCRIFS